MFACVCVLIPKHDQLIRLAESKDSHRNIEDEEKLQKIEEKIWG